MPEACTIGDNMAGSVGHHAGHIVGHTGDGDPIYCSGHSVTGVQKTGKPKVVINGIPIATVTKIGSTDCPCDGADYTNVQGSNKVIVEGLSAVRIGDAVDIHGQGMGVMVTGKSKVIMA